MLSKVKFPLALLVSSSLLVCDASAYESSLGNKISSFDVSGYVQFDYSVYANTKGGQSGTDLVNQYYRSGSKVRRSRLSFSGDAGDKWSWGIGFKKDGSNAIHLNTISASFTPIEGITISTGKIYAAYGLESAHSAFTYNFLENSILDQITGMSTRRGTNLNIDHGMFHLEGSVFYSDRKNGAIEKADGSAYDFSDSSKFNFGGSARLRVTLSDSEDKKQHVGVSAFYEEQNKETVNYKTINYQIGPDNFGIDGITCTLSEFRGPGTKFPAGSSHDEYAPSGKMYLGAEYVGVFGPLSLKAETSHITLKNETPTSGDGSVTGIKGEDKWFGFNGEVAYVVTGESRNYSVNGGTLGSLKPSSDNGAFELAARFTYLDMTGDNIKNDIGAVYMGWLLAQNSDKSDNWHKMYNWTVGGTWYASENANIKANIVYHQLSDAMSKKLYQDAKTGHNLLGFGIRGQISL